MQIIRNSRCDCHDRQGVDVLELMLKGGKPIRLCVDTWVDGFKLCVRMGKRESKEGVRTAP